jgi:hypothetical protein
MANFSRNPAAVIRKVILTVFREDGGEVTEHASISHDLSYYAGLSRSETGEELKTVILDPYFKLEVPAPWNQSFIVNVVVIDPQINKWAPSAGRINAADLIYLISEEDIGSWLLEVGPSAACGPADPDPENAASAR